MKKHTQCGYILIVTLLMIAGMTAIGTYIFLRTSVFVPFMHTMYDREKAKMLALGGLQLGIQQLSQFDQPETQEGTSQQASAKKETPGNPKQFFARIMPLVNRWQTIQLQEKIDGIQGTIQLCLVCEEGKININRIYNFEKGTFNGQGQPKGDWQKLLIHVCRRIEEVLGGKDLFISLENFLKNRKYPLYDVTELLMIKEGETYPFDIFRDHIFYQPPDKKTDHTKATIYLTDLFTIFSDKNSIEPRLFSDSLLGILQLPQTVALDIAKQTEQIKNIEKNFKTTSQWPQDWATQIKPFYEKELQSLMGGLDAILNTQFNPVYFSLFAYGTVGNVTQRLLAIVKRDERKRKGETGYDVVIKKIYWL